MSCTICRIWASLPRRTASRRATTCALVPSTTTRRARLATTQRAGRPAIEQLHLDPEQRPSRDRDRRQEQDRNQAAGQHATGRAAVEQLAQSALGPLQRQPGAEREAD